MPYITQRQRARLESDIDKLIKNIEVDLFTGHDGTTNYVITRILDGLYGMGNYAMMSRGLGCLEAVKQEFYHRRVAPYEDKKITENGDVY